MRQLRLIIRYAVWLVVFASEGCGRKSVSQVVGGSPLAQSPSMLPTTSATQSPAIVPSVTPSPEAKPGQTASVDLPKLEKAVQPSVILVTVFDPKGNLLRTKSVFLFLQTADSLPQHAQLKAESMLSQKPATVESTTSPGLSRLRKNRTWPFCKRTSSALRFLRYTRMAICHRPPGL